MTFTEAAAEVLRLVGKPLHYKDITEIAIQKNLLSHVGKSPEVTMGSRLAALLKKGPKENPLVRVKPGVFALRAWEDGGPPGPAPDVDPAIAAAAAVALADGEPEPEPSDDDEDAKPLVPMARSSAPVDLDDEERAPPAPDEQHRADLAAHAVEVFGEEEDDDQPIFGAESAPDSAAGGRRRRRRRRGRGAGPDAPREAGTPDGLPSYTVSPAFEGEPRAEGEGEVARAERPEGEVARAERPEGDRPRRDRGDRGDREHRGDRDRDRDRGDRDRGARDERRHEGPAEELDDVAGRDMADTVVWLLGGFDRNGGPVALRALADAAIRRGRLTGDPGLIASAVAAAARADNARRAAEGRRQRFRFAGGRLALTEWALGGELARLEQDAFAALERYRDGARRALARRIAELSPNGFVEICLAVLERQGISQLKPVRRPGGPGPEAFFSGVQRTAGGELKVAVVIRKDGREISRERVVEVRGSAHHFGPAAAAWLLTAGQVLSGAREETAAPGGLPVSMLDGAGIARACEESGIGVVRTNVSVSLPDADLFDALKGS